jgi:4-amino-4-deoxychorismate lyase
LSHHGVSVIPSLAVELEKVPIKLPGRVRLRIEYDTKGLFEIGLFPYMRKQIDDLRIVHISPPDYRYKYADRAWINALVEKSDADEILMIRDGNVTDTSIANVTFYDGSTWLTPKEPLLMGTERSRLLNMGVIKESVITIRDISSFSGFRLINAMLPWEDDITYGMSVLKGA